MNVVVVGEGAEREKHLMAVGEEVEMNRGRY
jgi:hypothetical protein